jgi:hypothetical protein
MFWAALATLIMAMTGAGDDTFVFREFLEKMQEGVQTEVSDPARQQKALAAIDQTLEGFRQHRERVNKVSACIEKADRSYVVKVSDYEKCLVNMAASWDQAAETLIEKNRLFTAAVTDAELRQIQAKATLP